MDIEAYIRGFGDTYVSWEPAVAWAVQEVIRRLHAPIIQDMDATRAEEIYRSLNCSGKKKRMLVEAAREIDWRNLYRWLRVAQPSVKKRLRTSVFIKAELYQAAKAPRLIANPGIYRKAIMVALCNHVNEGFFHSMPETVKILPPAQRAQVMRERFEGKMVIENDMTAFECSASQKIKELVTAKVIEAFLGPKLKQVFHYLYIRPKEKLHTLYFTMTVKSVLLTGEYITSLTNSILNLVMIQAANNYLSEEKKWVPAVIEGDDSLFVPRYPLEDVQRFFRSAGLASKMNLVPFHKACFCGLRVGQRGYYDDPTKVVCDFYNGISPITPQSLALKAASLTYQPINWLLINKHCNQSCTVVIRNATEYEYQKYGEIGDVKWKPNSNQLVVKIKRMRMPRPPIEIYEDFAKTVGVSLDDIYANEECILQNRPMERMIPPGRIPAGRLNNTSELWPEFVEYYSSNLCKYGESKIYRAQN